jgi:hypothetical protein
MIATLTAERAGNAASHEAGNAMAKELLVGMCNLDGPIRIPSDNWQMRLQDLRNAMDQAFGLPVPNLYSPPAPLALGPAPAPPPTLRIFLAPEYFFRKNRGRSQAASIPTTYTQGEWFGIQDGLLQLSQRYANLLLMGGSVFWLPESRGRLVKKALHIERAPIRHSIVVAHAGNLLLIYDKKNDCNELYQFETNLYYQFMPGMVAGTFTCDGLQCGVETCVDHATGQLAKDGAANLDLQIIVSNTVAVHTPNVVANNTGFVLHCNANSSVLTGVGTDVYYHPFTLVDKLGGGYRSQGQIGPTGYALHRLMLP